MPRLDLELAGIDCTVLRGHFLTRGEAAAYAGVSAWELRSLDGVVRIDGPYGNEEAYPDFQFAGDGGFVPGLRDVVTRLEGYLPGPTLAGYLIAPQPDLGGASVVEWLSSGNSTEAVINVVQSAVSTV